MRKICFGRLFCPFQYPAPEVIPHRTVGVPLDFDLGFVRLAVFVRVFAPDSQLIPRLLLRQFRIEDAQAMYNNWANDPQVILALTRKMQQQMVVSKTDNGWGIGYTNRDDYNKAIWNEARYKKAIWDLSEKEIGILKKEAEEYINQKLND